MELLMHDSLTMHHGIFHACMLVVELIAIYFIGF